MSPFQGRLRGLLVALVSLLLTAGVAFAGAGAPPAAADPGLQTASDAAGKVVPVRAGDEDEDVDEPGTDVEEPDEELTEEEPAEEEPAEEELGEHPDNHGAIVSEAASMDLPDGFETRGEFVSCVARMNHGHEDPEADPEAEIVLADLTPEDCARDAEETDAETDADEDAAETEDATDATRGKGHTKTSHGKGHGRGRSGH